MTKEFILRELLSKYEKKVRTHENELAVGVSTTARHRSEEELEATRIELLQAFKDLVE